MIKSAFEVAAGMRTFEKINIDREENKQYIEQYDLMGTPTMIVLDDDGTELGRIVGAKGITPEILREKVNSL